MISTKCPYCNDEMETGFVQSARMIFFDKREKYFMILPSKNSIRLTGNSFEKPIATAMACKKCNFVIIPYNNENN